MGADSLDDPDKMPQHAMARWYSPRLLLRTGFRAAIATAIGEITDNREVQAALTPFGKDKLSGAYDYSRRQELTIDYVADLGDGWDATYAVARAIAAPHLRFGDEEVGRAGILVMGGDEIYPGPSTEAYRDRTVAPYRTACAEHEAFEADLFALPGNHDWYDGLHAFTELFCRGGHDYPGRDGDGFGSWRTRQRRSYFALKLPHRWWLCGVDIQLDRRLNATQLDYFQNISDKAITKGDKIILCAALPSWVLEQIRDHGATRNLTDIAEIFERNGADLKLVMSGDLHHYSHYVPRDQGPHLVTAGGGGAFLHPTHKLPDEVHVSWRDGRREDYDMTVAYPDQQVSRALAYKNLLFSFTNWDFSLMIGGIYALLSWFLETRRLGSGQSLSEAFRAMMDGHRSVLSTLGRFFETIPKSPEFAILVAVLVAGLTAFNISMNWRDKLLLGLGHSAVHFIALILSFCVAVEVVALTGLQLEGQFWGFVLFLATMVITGALLGGLVFGGFLLFSLNVLGLQWTNAFSSLRNQDYKNFARLRIDRQGRLTVYPFGIDRTGDAASEARPIEQSFTIE